MEDLDQIEELLEQLHQAVQASGFSDETDQRVTKFCNWLDTKCREHRRLMEAERADKWKYEIHSY
jgi:hypothetical protein